ncbi:MAG: hypothetical protein HN936_08465 [Bacteroidetes bacterium]|jgi:hypothetical protein|nr:hypothetical protein [Bacteroidota bacterium]
MKVSKILSKSDTGESGSNQSGVLVPKDKAILKFFPTLVEEKKNPRQTIVFSGPENDKWSFNFIHYNNLKYGGTRNEYRLTCIRGFLKKYNLHHRDILLLQYDQQNGYTINYEVDRNAGTGKKIILKNTWKVINI